MTARLGGGPTENQAACALAGRAGLRGRGDGHFSTQEVKLLAAALADRPGQSRLDGRDVVRQVVACPEAPAFVSHFLQRPWDRTPLDRLARLTCNYMPRMQRVPQGQHQRRSWQMRLACAGEGTDAGAAVCSLRHAP